MPSPLVNAFYFIKPIVPRAAQIGMRRLLVQTRMRKFAAVWPIDPDSGGRPSAFESWPGGKRFALVLTHDVDTGRGYENCEALMKLEKRLGFCSSFNFVPEKGYRVSPGLREKLVEEGFEVGVHGLNHDGKLFYSKPIFEERSQKINQYLKQWGAIGFRAPAMHHNLEWMHLLHIAYDASTFDTDPFEPQSNGCKKIFPFWVPCRQKDPFAQKGFVELPYTLPQDFTLFVLLHDYDLRIWREKLNWVAQKGGMVLLNTHPDYMSFNGGRKRMEQYPVELYEVFLTHIQRTYQGQYWNVLPREVAQFWYRNYSTEN